MEEDSLSVRIDREEEPGLIVGARVDAFSTLNDVVGGGCLIIDCVWGVTRLSFVDEDSFDTVSKMIYGSRDGVPRTIDVIAEEEEADSMCLRFLADRLDCETVLARFEMFTKWVIATDPQI